MGVVKPCITCGKYFDANKRSDNHCANCASKKIHLRVDWPTLAALVLCFFSAIFVGISLCGV